jgi:serine/threonine protein kinase
MELLNHESIVKLHETFESCDSLFLVMEYVPGWNLDEYLQKKEGGALNEEEARHLFRQLVSAVDYCHHRWIVHRDLKVRINSDSFLYTSFNSLFFCRLPIF